MLGFSQLSPPILFSVGYLLHHLTASSTNSRSSTVASIFEVIPPMMIQDAMSTSLQLFHYNGTAPTFPKTRARAKMMLNTRFCGRARPLKGLKQETTFLPLHTVCQIPRGQHHNPVAMSESVCNENTRLLLFSSSVSSNQLFTRSLPGSPCA